MKIQKTNPKLVSIALLLLILAIAGWIRTYNLNWDQGTHLHPDERYLTMVVSAIRFPSELESSPDGNRGLYWKTDESPLNPTNQPQFAGYVYGTLPLFSTRAVALLVDQACGDEPALSATLLRWSLLGTTKSCVEGHYTGYNGIHLVGRSLSTLADLATLLGLVLLGYILYDQWTAMLAGALYAFAVLPIQHAHFFVVDSFAAVLVIWTLLFAVLSSKKRNPWWLLLAGLTTGLAVASKISVWPLASMVALAAILQRKDETSSDYSIQFLPASLVALGFSGLLAAIAFRVAQPYAFTGPGFFGVLPNSQWLTTMKDLRELISGQRDVPFGHQWTQRAPIVFPWINMVFWGMGLPLGLAAWAGWAWGGWRIFSKAKWQYLLPWVWGTLFFLYQSTQWVKSMRYFLPVYPVFVLFAAWILGQLMMWARSFEAQTNWAKALKFLCRVLPGVVLIGTIVWCGAFLQIYAQPFTRVEASRWMYRYIPTAATFYTQDQTPVQVPLQPDTILSVGDMPFIFTLQSDDDVTLTDFVLNKINAFGLPGSRRLQLQIWEDSLGEMVLSEAVINADLLSEGVQSARVELNPPVVITEDQTIFLSLSLVEGDPIRLQTSIIANEHWDDALPVRIDGKDPYWNWYQSLKSSPSTQLNLYDNDTLEKRLQILDWLDETDYIALSSNRLYGSIPRLPMRYPLAVAYYEALFDGRLGFKVRAEFVSYLTVGICQFPDQENPFTVSRPEYTNAKPCSIFYPPAEEAFSVYDHPTVFIFEKTPAYSRQLAEQVLDVSLLDDVRWMTPLQVTRDKKGAAVDKLLMDEPTRDVQEANGTWSKLFNTQGLQNRSQLLAVLLWWAFLTLLGWMAFPWLYHAFPTFRYRGYGLGRILGLLLWAYPVWLLASLKILPYTRLVLWGTFFASAGVSILMVRSRWAEMRQFLVKNWRDLLRLEAIFAILYLVWVLIRYLNPDLWHPVVGGEKPMDFAYLNAVVKSTWFPPYDPWFSGGSMNYYYFGFVLIGSLIKTLGIVPSMAYNLAIPALFAMTGVGAYTLANNLAGGKSHRRHRAGLFGILLVLILGNFGELRLIFQGLEKLGNVEFESIIPGYQAAVSALFGLWKVIFEGKALLFRPEWWYWDATRVIPFDPGEVGAINEFPAFSFLYADLHAHVMAFPLTQLALAVALQWGIAGPSKRNTPTTPLWERLKRYFPGSVATFFVGALAAGSLRATNTWDYPTCLGLMTLGFYLYLFKDYSREKQNDETCYFPYLKLFLPIFLLLVAEILFRPFSANYVTTYTSFALWKGKRTPLGSYLVMHGQFIFPLVVLAAIQIRALYQRTRHNEWKKGILIPLGTAIAGMLMLWGVLLVLGVPVAWIVIPLGSVATLLVLDTGSSQQTRLLWLWVGTALTLSLLVEIVVLKGDIGRMNTVFKFYLQVWMLMALGAAVAVERIFNYVLTTYEQPASTRDAKMVYPYILSDGVFAIMLIILFSTALYPLLAIPAKIRDRWQTQAPHTLDGMASFMPYAVQYEHGAQISLSVDYDMIRWFQEEVEGTPTIIEGQAEREYLWGNRVSIYTGLPSVAAWRWHQVQQRMTMPGGTIERRQSAIRDFYNTVNLEQAMSILRLYDIQYIVLSPYERAYMLPEGESKFAAMVASGWLEVAYQSQDAVVYHVIVN